MPLAVEPRLFELFLEFGDLNTLDSRAKAALRLCNKQSKIAVDATVSACRITTDAADDLLRCDWKLTDLDVNDAELRFPPKKCSKVLPSTLVSKFPLVERFRAHTITFDENPLAVVPENIGDWSHLKTFIAEFLEDITLPSSFGHLTSLEHLEMKEFYCSRITLEGLKAS